MNCDKMVGDRLTVCKQELLHLVSISSNFLFTFCCRVVKNLYEEQCVLILINFLSFTKKEAFFSITVYLSFVVETIFCNFYYFSCCHICQFFISYFSTFYIMKLT